MMIWLLLQLGSSPQWPEDARQVLLWHGARQLEDGAGPAGEPALRDRLYAYQAAGAEAEAWEASRALEALAPGDPDGDRYRVQLCVWDPARWTEGFALAESWLRQNPGRPDPELQAVAAAQAVLAERLTTRSETAQRQRARGWVPWLALALFLGTSARIVRGAR